MSTAYYEKRIVAFIDILGFKSLIEETQQPECTLEKLDNIKSAFDLIHQMLAEHYENDQIEQVKYSTFSDCIVFSFPARQTNSLFLALLPLIWLQAELVWKHDILLRGVMTIGDIYHEDKVVFGPALVEAYELETKKAFYPRIILDPKIQTEYELWLDDVKKRGNVDQIHELENEQRYTFKPEGLLTRDDDGFYYVDYLDKILGEMDAPENYQDFIGHVDKLIQPYLKPDIDVSLLKKYVWLHEKLQKIKLKF